MKKKINIKRYQMGVPNLVPQGTQKAITDTANSMGQNLMNNNTNLLNQGVGMGKDFLQSQKNMYGKAFNVAGNAMNKFSGKKFQGGTNSAATSALDTSTNLAADAAKKFNYEGNLESLAAKLGSSAGGGGAAGAAGIAASAIPSIAGALLPLIIKPEDRTKKPYAKGSKLIKYQGGTENIIGPGPLDKLKEFTPEQLKSFNAYENNRDINAAIERVNAMGTPVSSISPKMASLNIPQTGMSGKPTPVPTQKQSRKERKMDNLKNERLLNKQDVEYMTPRTPTLGGNIPDRKPLVKMVEQQPITAKKPKMFDYTSKEAKGGYARALKYAADNKGITKQGWLTDPETGLVYKDLRSKKTNTSNPKAGQELVRMSRMGENPLYKKSVGVPEPIKRNYPKSTGEYQPVGLGEKYQAGTKSLTKDEGRVAKGSEYFAQAKKLTPAQKAEFRKLDAQAKKEGKTFSFQGLKYDPAAFANASKGKSTQTPTPDKNKTAQHTTDDAGKKMVNPQDDNSRYAFGEKPITFMGDTFSIRPSTFEKAGKRAASVAGAFGWGPLAIPTLGAVGTASLLDAVNELTPRGSNFEKYLSNVSNTLDTGASLAGTLGATVGIGKGVRAGYNAVKNPKEALQKIKDLWAKRNAILNSAPQTAARTGRRSGKLGSAQGFNQNPLQTF